MNMIVDPGRALFAKRQRALSDGLLRKAQATPVNHWAQGLNQLSASLVGNYLGKKATESEAAIEKDRRGRLSQMLAGPGGINPGDLAGMGYEDAAIRLASQPKPQDKLPGVAAEFEYARANGFGGDFMDYQRTKATMGGPRGTTVNVNQGGGPQIEFAKAPPGYAYVIDPQSGMPTAVKIEGGPAADKAAAEVNQAGDTIALIDQALEHPGLNDFVGRPNSLTGAAHRLGMETLAAGSDVSDYAAIHEQLGGQAFLTAVQQMKGSGQLSNAEGQTAQRAIARMDRNQSPEAYREALMEYRGILQRAMGRPPGWAETQGAEQSAPDPGQLSQGAVVDGYVFMGGDPADENNWRAQ